MLRRRKVILSLLSVLCFLVVWLCWDFALAYERGRLAAHLDVSHGRYRILGYGLPAPWRDDYAAILRERYGVEFRPVARCIVSQPLADYVRGYDEVSEAAIRQEFGDATLTEASDEAWAQWKQKQVSETMNR